MKRRIDLGMGLVVALLAVSVVTLLAVITDFRGDTRRDRAHEGIFQVACRQQAVLETLVEVDRELVSGSAKLDNSSELLRAAAAEYKKLQERLDAVAGISCAGGQG